MGEKLEEVQELQRLISKDPLLSETIRVLLSELNLKESPEEGGYDFPGFGSELPSWTFLEVENERSLRLYHPNVEEYEKEIIDDADWLAGILGDCKQESDIGQGKISLAAGHVLAGKLEEALEPIGDWRIEVVSSNHNHHRRVWESLDGLRFCC